MASCDVYLDQADPTDVTDAELRAWTGISLRVMKSTIIGTEDSIRRDSERPPDSIAVDRFMRLHALAFKRILYTKDFAEKQFIPRAMTLHMMMKDKVGLSMEKQLVYLEGLMSAFEAAEASGRLVVSTQPASQEVERRIKDTVEELERETVNPWTGSYNVCMANPPL